MNGKHNVKTYYQIVDKLKFWRPDIALSSDFIVGFPEETDKDFDLTMELIEEVNYTIAYSFMFSPRPGTPAYKLSNLNENIKKARLSALQALLKKQQKKYNEKFVGKKIEILFERQGRHINQYIGRSIYNQSVFVSCEKNLIGHMLNVKIKDTNDFSLEGLTYGK